MGVGQDAQHPLSNDTYPSVQAVRLPHTVAQKA
jgi:hypothetical protein